ncbi:ABC transporter permease [Caldibacillus sp. 210928-DFI.2.22]|uniref:ABC transporter permease n=1 Tax=unclassified Caldibacillus TaxID=2641266 RepID=UPI001D0672FD|nr:MULTISPECIES: ABC transporter permease [unclassified Caldibacillus]MCB7071253.1 ABC transporter permease [Caldibacillus sp. 210928-DFI.2.22]MCB7074720.1 ABC transporter permease [Caldibacillus sp. 210928-DFI.2.18]
MNKFWIIFFHTFLTKLKTKSFIVTTVITLLIIVLLANITNIIDFFNKGEEGEKIAVIDETGVLFDPFQNQLEAIDKDIQLKKFTGDGTKADKQVQNGDFDGVLVLSYNQENLPAAVYRSLTISNTSLLSSLENGLQQMKTQMAATQMNLSQEQLTKLYEPVSLKKVALEKDAKTEEELSQARGLVYVLLFVIYFAVIMYANMIAMEVATEKSSRVMEILISSVPPIKQMFAKILGVGLLGLLQLALMLGVAYFSLKQNMDSMEGGFFDVYGFGDVPVATLVYAFVFFLLGYFLYATLAAFLGSLVSRIEDVNQLITPMTYLLIIGFMIAMFGLVKPDATFITVTSYIPFFTPMLMFMRVGMLNLPIWEPILGIVILLVTIILFAIFGAKVYKGGVLLYGKSSSFKDIKKAMQLTKNE